MKLSRLTYCSPEQKVKIVEIDGGTGAIENIKSLGLNIGDEIVFKSRKNGHGKIVVQHKNKELIIGLL